MATQHDPREQLRQAKQIASDHGCFVLEKKAKDGIKTKFVLCRRLPNGHSTTVGTRQSVAGLHRLVCAATNFH